MRPINLILVFHVMSLMAPAALRATRGQDARTLTAKFNTIQFNALNGRRTKAAQVQVADVAADVVAK